jgi:prepilin-type processing-associated H-X9-DG protein
MTPLANGYMVMTPPMANSMSFGRSNYPGVLGADVNWMTGAPANPSGGAFGMNSRRNFRDFTDGLSNTVIVGERHSPLVTNNGTLYTGGDSIWPGVGCDMMAQGMALQLGDCSNAHRLNMGFATAPTPTSADSYVGFSSLHIGGAHFLMGDGSVRFISENIASGTSGVVGSTYQNLSMVADGIPIGDF